MSVKVRWVLAGILCLCTLVALWVTGARVKGLKMAKRYGDRTPIAAAPVDPAGPSRLTLRRGPPVSAGHFSLDLDAEGAVRVLDASGAALVEFPQVRKGDLRRWQELLLAFVEVAPDAVTVEVTFTPGSPCLGTGRYRALRQGLQIHFPGFRSFTVSAWDPKKPELTLDMTGPGGKVTTVLGPDGNGEAFKVAHKLRRDPAGAWVLDLRDLD